MHLMVQRCGDCHLAVSDRNKASLYRRRCPAIAREMHDIIVLSAMSSDRGLLRGHDGQSSRHGDFGINIHYRRGVVVGQMR